MIQAWYENCNDGYPWWRITGQAYREYFAIPPGGGVETLDGAIARDLVLLGVRAIASRFGITGRPVQLRARKLGYRAVGTTGHWIAPEEAA